MIFATVPFPSFTLESLPQLPKLLVEWLLTLAGAPDWLVYIGGFAAMACRSSSDSCPV